MKKGFLCLVLHAHLPYVRHPEAGDFLEERWLFEAITECYLPLLQVFERLLEDSIPFRLSLSLSPTLITMLADELLQSRYIIYLQNLIDLAEKEIARTKGDPAMHNLARFYHRLFSKTLQNFQERYHGDLLSVFRKHQQVGNLELLTTAATHGFLPLLSVSDTAVRNQIQIGLQTFESYFGALPQGFWLPECGYYPGLESLLLEAGISYFFVDTHGILHASQRPRCEVYEPLDCGNGVMAFGRDPESSRQVWSAQEGYPGDFDYREYYRDIGFDLDLGYLAPCLPEGKIRINTGIKYYRVTGGDRPKAVYEPQRAREKARLHAVDFLQKRQRQIEKLSESMEIPPVLVAPYDAELFGHWWFEGPVWLEAVLRQAATNPDGPQLATCGDYLKAFPDHPVATPSASSWGGQGYSSFWINDTNDWIYPLLHKAESELEAVACQWRDKSNPPWLERALDQAARSLLLAQGSDWPFIMQSGTTVDYANKRITDHLARFNYLMDAIRNHRINERYLVALETMDAIFPDLDFRDYCPKHS
ncbi:MAG: glycoside hydrolase [Methylothermaceae bacteria B42]|nr:MAG: glycoside hydrolase [Methylothermaceae bacteria B42]HHJ38119.1 DUF1957 domain-containing protein [Methylothermaceae bacterium]